VLQALNADTAPKRISKVRIVVAIRLAMMFLSRTAGVLASSFPARTLADEHYLKLNHTGGRSAVVASETTLTCWFIAGDHC
jgi:hypothetical protein